MRATKKGISGMLVLCLMLVGLLMPTQVMAASDSGVDGEIKWEVSEEQGEWGFRDRLTISAVEGTQGRMKEYSSAESAPWYNYTRYPYPDKIIINEGVTTIAENAFTEYFGKVVFPKSIEKINVYASSNSGQTRFTPRIVYGYQGTCAETFATGLRKAQENNPDTPQNFYLTSFIPLDAPATPSGTPLTVTAAPTNSKVFVAANAGTSGDRTYEKVEAYNINGNNYFKLRDVAKMIVQSGWDFDVTWDNEKKAVNILSGKAYTEVGGELAKGDGKAKTAVASSASIFQNGYPIVLTAYNIDGNNYVKLRDLAYYLDDMYVSWDAATDTISIKNGGRG